MTERRANKEEFKKYWKLQKLMDRAEREKYKECSDRIYC